MSMNLTCHNNGEEVWLDFQTPTWATFLILSYAENGYQDGGQEGVRRRYFLWLDSLSQGRWESSEALREILRRVAAEKERIGALKNPTFSFI